MSKDAPQNSIEYVCGPFDGYVEPVPEECEELPEDLLCIVSDNVFRLMDCRVPLPNISFTSIAMYSRTRRNGAWVYFFAGALGTEKIREACAQAGMMFGTINENHSSSPGRYPPR